MEYKSIPVSDKKIKAMQEHSPELYNEFVTRYGVENVHNNIIADFVILQEEKKISPIGSKAPIDITNDDVQDIYIETTSAEKLRKIERATNNNVDKFFTQPINAFKSWISDEYIGHIPVLFNHPTNIKSAEKHGYVVDGSLKLIKLKDRLHLLCQCILISPESKYNYINGLWREVSPTFANNKIMELSFVKGQPAQLANSSLANGEATMNNSVDSFLAECRAKLNEAKREDAHRQLQLEIQNQEQLANSLADCLVKELVINSANRKSVTKSLLSLGSGEAMQLMVNTMRENIPRHARRNPTFILQGALMQDTSTQMSRFNEFQAANAANYKDADQLLDAFIKLEQQNQKNVSSNTVVSLGSGEKDTMKLSAKEILSKLLEEDEELDDEMKDTIKKLCSKKGIKLGDGEMPKEANTDNGGMAEPNNTKLGNGEADTSQLHTHETIFKTMADKLVEQANLIEQLQQGAK